ncbi:MAG: alpha/beta hydrolase [Burkholderiaceae bacterium]|jgi:arylformamidase|nr:alpha/beta hydrolase [Burkholderiaceae bacterium]
MTLNPEVLEREYNARASIPDHPEIFARWAEQGALTRRRRAGLIDVPYGDDAGERLDFFPTPQDRPPLLVFIHGGYWRSLDKFDFSWIAPTFLDAGAAVALLNYGLTPRVTVEEIVRQQLKAMAWLYRRADDLGFDRDRIVVSGHSAGGHLTAMMMAAQWPAFDPGLPADLIKGGLAISGIYDLEPLVPLPFINADLRLDAAAARRLSPVHMPPATPSPLVTAVGGLESAEFKRQTQLIRRAWPKNAREDLDVPGANHLTVCDQLAVESSPLFHAALALVKAA